MVDRNDVTPEVRRLRWLVRGGLFWTVALGARLVHLQVVEHEELLRQADSQQERDYEILAPRGTIYDRNGEQLAVSVPVFSLAVNPKKITDVEREARTLAGILKMPEKALASRISAAREEERGFLWIKRKLDPAEVAKLRALKGEWLDFRRESRREYPHKESGAAVIGSVNHREEGNSGVELTLQKELEGTPGYVRMLTDVRRRGVDVLHTIPPQPGKNVGLAIDAQLQFHCDRLLKEAAEANGCQSGTIVVQEPHTGEILALSSYPSFDPNEPLRHERDLASRLHRAASQALDPGSVFKMFTVASALSCTRLRPETVIQCGSGLFRFGSLEIHDGHAYGPLRMEQVLWKSSNLGAIQIGKAVGLENLHRYLKAFGFGAKTGIPLPGENPGILKSPDECWAGSLYWMSIGHEVTATTLQLAQACSVFANGGLRVRPKLVRWTQSAGRERERTPASAKEQVITPDVAVDMRRMSEGVVLYGTGRKARVHGFTIGGKTGTAQVVDAGTGAYVKHYSSSFMGYGPLNRPSVVAVVTLNGTRKFGGEIAAPVFVKVVEQAFRILGQEPDLPVEEKAAAVPERPEPEIEPSSVPADVLRTASHQTHTVGPLVPDFRGMNKLNVARSAAELGMPLEVSGKGVARKQYPPAGSVLASGERVRVHFAR